MAETTDTQRTPAREERELRVYADLDALTRAARSEFLERAELAIRKHRRFTVCLSGGTTPERLYASLADAGVDWSRVHFFFGDERHVPPDHRDSNYLMVREALFERAGLPGENVHRILAERPAAEAAALYEAELRAFFALPAGAVPRFDLVLMGMGPDGHTASLFPNDALLDERERLVASARIEALGVERITLTMPVFEAAACLLFLVSGADKAPALARIFAADPGESELPSGRIRARAGELVWLVDRAAAPTLES
jgi:6-phosphogluconolactonase